MADTGAPQFIPLLEDQEVSPHVKFAALANTVNEKLLTPMGAWDSGTTYYFGAIVSYNNSLYVAQLAGTNKNPETEPTYWETYLTGTPTGPTGPGYYATSTDSRLIEVASKTFTVQSGLAYVAGGRVRAISIANNANWMEGPVTSYSGTTLVVNVEFIGGSGTYADWVFTVAGRQGVDGNAGATGAPFTINATDVIANRGTYDSEAAGFVFISTDESKLYVRIGTSGWSDGVPYGAIADNRIVISGGFIDPPFGGAAVVHYIAAFQITLPSGLTGSQFHCITNPTSTAVFTITKNGSSIGSASISTSGVATFTFSSAVTLDAGDILVINAPSTSDLTLEDGTFSLLGTIS